MEFLKSLSEGKGLFNEHGIIGLSGLKKQPDYIKISIPEGYKKTFMPDYKRNYMLF